MIAAELMTPDQAFVHAWETIPVNDPLRNLKASNAVIDAIVVQMAAQAWEGGVDASCTTFPVSMEENI